MSEGTTTGADHPQRATAFIKDHSRAQWHDQALWFIRTKRDRAIDLVPEWQTLRETAAAIKAHTVARLPEYLEQFEANATAAGATVHWARNADEHNRIVLQLLQKHSIKRIVKSKSMLTEECHLNPFLEQHGIEVTDTDLGERIVQFRNEPPSHIVLPAIHLKKEDVGDTFAEHLGTPKGLSDPQQLTEAARLHLREKFMQAEAGITGVNFAIAESGGIVVCTNEGNADLGCSLPRLHIACMGIEKLIPRVADLGVFTRLLARSATGQPVTTYTSHFQGPQAGGELHIVMVDNGRSQIRASDDYRRSLNCIRCGACMNTCPVYRRSGGHSYGSTIPGPIGSILSPSSDPSAHRSLPFACTLCGSCTDVCPVQIDLHHQLLTWRKDLASQGFVAWTKRLSMVIASFVMARPWLYTFAGTWGKRLGRWLPRALLMKGPAAWMNPWVRSRELPPLPAESFRGLMKKRNKR